MLFDLSELLQWFDERPELKQYLKRASDVAKTIRQFKVPAYQVEQDDVEVLQDIFDRLNNYGKRLSKAEIFTALTAGAEDEAADRLTIPLIAENVNAERGFGILDGDTVLKVILARRHPDVLRDPRIPTLAPAYDLVSTGMYRDPSDPETLGLKLHNTRRFDRITLDSFTRLENRIGAAGAGLADVAADTVERATRAWRELSASVGVGALVADVTASIEQRRKTLLRGGR